jgi:CRP-like cAMP-binding protein
MISPEILRRYPFFGHLEPGQLKAIAMIAEEMGFQKNDFLLEEGQPANSLFLLVDGNIDLIFISKDEFHPEHSKVFNVGEINPGEVFGISALIEPYIYSSTAQATSVGKCLKIDAVALRALFELDQRLGCTLTRQVAKAAMERLAATRVQLAAAR